jgi:adenosine deaminase
MPDAPVSQTKLRTSYDYYRTLPKVELHRHLEGSLRLKTIQEIASREGRIIPAGMVKILAGQPRTPQNLFDKFTVLRSLYRSEEIIRRVVREAIEDAARDNVIHLELRFTPAALSQASDFPLEKVMDWVSQEQQAASQMFPIRTRLIASVNRHENTQIARRVAELAVERIQVGITGLDLAGDETGYPATPFLPIFQSARQRGLKICLHAGEWINGENLIEAIKAFEANRIGHGIRVIHSPRAIQAALNKEVFFEICPTSNVLSGAVQDYASHPVKNMLEEGLGVTINTDNPGITGMTLSREYYRVCQKIGLNREQLYTCVLNAAKAAFLSPSEREQLISYLAMYYG